MSADSSFCDAISKVLCGCKVIHPSAAELLGAPIGPEDSIVSLKNIAAALRSARDRLLKIDRHDALTILKVSLGHPKVAYMLRAGSYFDSPGLALYDSGLRETVISCLNVRIEEASWLQATLPPRDGGLGLTSATSLALQAYVASFCATRDLSCKLLKSEPVTFIDDTYELNLAFWKASVKNVKEPSAGEDIFAWKWRGLLLANDISTVAASAKDPRDASRIRAVASVKTASLFSGLPNARLGTRLSNDVFTVSVALRLGVAVAAPGVCVCGCSLDAYGDHALVCRRGAGRYGRHTEINSRLKGALAEAGVSSILEPTGLTRSDGNRPDGATVLPYSRGVPMAWDATIIHSCAFSYLHASANSSGAAAAAAKERKKTKYASLGDGISFVPFALETLGPFGLSARRLLSDLVARISSRTGKKKVRARLNRQFAAAVQAGNAACVLEAHGRPT